LCLFFRACMCSSMLQKTPDDRPDISEILSRSELTPLVDAFYARHEDLTKQKQRAASLKRSNTRRKARGYVEGGNSSSSHAPPPSSSSASVLQPSSTVRRTYNARVESHSRHQSVESVRLSDIYDDRRRSLSSSLSSTTRRTILEQQPPSPPPKPILRKRRSASNSASSPPPLTLDRTQSPPGRPKHPNDGRYSSSTASPTRTSRHFPHSRSYQKASYDELYEEDDDLSSLPSFSVPTNNSYATASHSTRSSATSGYRSHKSKIRKRNSRPSSARNSMSSTSNSGGSLIRSPQHPSSPSNSSQHYHQSPPKSPSSSLSPKSSSAVLKSVKSVVTELPSKPTKRSPLRRLLSFRGRSSNKDRKKVCYFPRGIGFLCVYRFSDSMSHCRSVVIALGTFE